MREAAYLVLVGLATAAMGAPEPVVQLAGTDFAGGASSLLGEVQSGVGRVNYVYAAPTGAYSRMKAAFELTETPSVPVMLYLYARDDDSPHACPIRITLNEEVVFAGPSAFPGDAYAWRTYPVPNDALEAGKNMLLVENTASDGRLGMPPWFEALWQHYAWMQNRGMQWFCLSLDDITRGIDVLHAQSTVMGCLEWGMAAMHGWPADLKESS